MVLSRRSFFATRHLVEHRRFARDRRPSRLLHGRTGRRGAGDHQGCAPAPGATEPALPPGVGRPLPVLRPGTRAPAGAMGRAPGAATARRRFASGHRPVLQPAGRAATTALRRAGELGVGPWRRSTNGPVVGLGCRHRRAGPGGIAPRPSAPRTGASGRCGAPAGRKKHPRS